MGQDKKAYTSIIEEIGLLEANKDPKCYATAARLEDFMFGTPLSPAARNTQIENQKDLVCAIWKLANKNSKNLEISVSVLKQAATEYVRIDEQNLMVFISPNEGEDIKLTERDLSHYSSVAFSLRAILSIQQEQRFNGQRLIPLTSAVIKQFKEIIDIASLAALKRADYTTRKAGKHVIGKEEVNRAWQDVVTNVEARNRDQDQSYSIKKQQEFLSTTIKQKLQSYEKYNEITQAVFLRNIQVYFAKKEWPTNPEEQQEIVNLFQDAIIDFSIKLISQSVKNAKADKAKIVFANHVQKTFNDLLPYTLNNFEDVTFYPALDRSKQRTIESYDLDAFRDSGLHWKMLEYALKESKDLDLFPDPFALELIVEAIAQYGVLLWREAGSKTEQTKMKYLSSRAMNQAVQEIRNKIILNSKERVDIQSEIKTFESAKASVAISRSKKNYFIDVTKDVGISFQHRSADWLSRQIRSYVVNKENNTARLAIPPAFGGGGVACADVNEDGWEDILLLGGAGSQLLINQKGESFDDITSISGIKSIRPDGSQAEPRQPIIADFDNDGHQDVFISFVGDDHQIYRGDGTGQFTDKSLLADLGGQGLVGGPCTAFDFDNDGYLDIYIGYFGNYINGHLPTLSRHNTNGTSNSLFKNLGNFEFIDVTELSGTGNTGWTQAVGHTDINNDGWQDLIIGNDFGINAYYINNGNGTFSDNAFTFRTDKPSYTMNIGVTDLNHDPYPDFYISNIVVMEKDDKYVLPNQETMMHFNPISLERMRVIEANDLFVSTIVDGGLTYVASEAIDRGLEATSWSWDADFFDYDNDGDEDLFCTNGMNDYSVYGTNNPFYDSSSNDDREVIYASSKSAQNVLFDNHDGQLQMNESNSGLNLDATSRSAAYLDYDNDGDLDIILSNYHDEANLFNNQSQSVLDNNWLRIKLSCLDTDVNADCIGTKVYFTPDEGGPSRWQELHSTDGYMSVHSKTLHFGLGDATGGQIQILWPNKEERIIDITEINTTYTIKL